MYSRKGAETETGGGRWGNETGEGGKSTIMTS